MERRTFLKGAVALSAASVIGVNAALADVLHNPKIDVMEKVLFLDHESFSYSLAKFGGELVGRGIANDKAMKFWNDKANELNKFLVFVVPTELYTKNKKRGLNTILSQSVMYQSSFIAVREEDGWKLPKSRLPTFDPLTQAILKHLDEHWPTY